MLKMIITEAFVSKGYNGAPAIKFIDTEGGGQLASFRIGKKVYDRKAENNSRWLNFTVKAFDPLCERIKSMKLKEGSCINLVARYDEESWTDKESGEQRNAVVLYLDELEYAGGASKNGQNSEGSSCNDGRQGQQNTRGNSRGQQPPQQNYPQNQQGYPQGQQGYPQGQPPQGYPQGQLPQGYPQNQQPPAPMPGNFTGFESMNGGANPYY